MKKTTSIFILLLFFTSLFAQKPYYGAEVHSKEEVLYGKFEMRMKMIKGSGMLSTFYTLKQGSVQDDACWEELDIEVFGKDNSQTMSTNIIVDTVGGDLVYYPEEIYLDYSLADNFHIFALEWTPSYVAWFIDGVEYRRDTSYAVNDLNLAQDYRFNAWISSTPAWVGPIDSSVMPCYQYIDWIEYSSYDESSEDFTPVWRDDFNSFDSSRWLKAEWTFDGNEVDFIKENAFIEEGKLVLAITNRNSPISKSEKSIDER